MTKTLKATAADDAKVRQMLASTVLVDVTFHKFGSKRAVTTDGCTVESESGEAQPMSEAAWALSKRLLKSKAVSAINTHFGHVRKALLQISVPAFDREGVYRVAFAAVDRAEAILMDAQRVLREDLRPAFLADYARAKADAKAQQGPKFNEKDYPSAEDAANRYGIEWDWMAVGVPAALEHVNTLIYQKASAKARQQAQQTFAAVEQTLRAGILACVEKMRADLLITNTTGKPRAYRADALAKVNEFFATFPLRNVIADGPSADALAQMTAILNRIPGAEALDDGFLRADIVAGLGALAETVRPFITDADSRAIVLPDED